MRAKLTAPIYDMWMTRLQAGNEGQSSEPSLQSAFAALGLPRVVAGMRALYMGGAWDACFLALAYGEPGELGNRVLEKFPLVDNVSGILGISGEDVLLLTLIFDHDRKHFESELTTWLESVGVNAATMQAEARREAEVSQLKAWKAEQERKRPFHVCHSRHFVDPASLKIL